MFLGCFFALVHKPHTIGNDGLRGDTLLLAATLVRSVQCCDGGRCMRCRVSVFVVVAVIACGRCKCACVYVDGSAMVNSHTRTHTPTYNPLNVGYANMRIV